MRKGKSGAQEDPRDHRSRPLASLKDPEAFGPPPKNVRYYGNAAASDTITPDMTSLGTSVQLRNPKTAEAGAQENPSPPPIPFRANRTGLDTTALSKTPAYRPNREATPDSPGASTGAKHRISLPPRLLQRQNSELSQGASLPESPPPKAALQPQSILSQSALNRLGSAGVSVPSLGIERQASRAEPTSRNAALQPRSIINKSALDRLGSADVSVRSSGTGQQPDAGNPWQDEPSSSTSRAFSSTFNGQQRDSDLRSEFAKLSTVTMPPDAPSQGTTFAEKQVSKFRNDPSSVTLADGKNAVSTVNNLRELHGNHVAAGWQSASGLKKKYGKANKVSNLAPDTVGALNPTASSSPASLGASAPLPPSGKKPPPPPPKRLGGLSSSGKQAPPCTSSDQAEILNV